MHPTGMLRIGELSSEERAIYNTLKPERLPEHVAKRKKRVEESGVGAELDAAAIPIHPLALKAEEDGWVPSALALALHGGEDYELLFTAPKWTAIPRRIACARLRRLRGLRQRRRLPGTEDRCSPPWRGAAGS